MYIQRHIYVRNAQSKTHTINNTIIRSIMPDKQMDKRKDQEMVNPHESPPKQRKTRIFI